MTVPNRVRVPKYEQCFVIRQIGNDCEVALIFEHDAALPIPSWIQSWAIATGV